MHQQALVYRETGCAFAATAIPFWVMYPRIRIRITEPILYDYHIVVFYAVLHHAAVTIADSHQGV